MKEHPMKTICFKCEFVIISLSIMVFLGTGNLYHAHATDKSAGEPGRSSGKPNPLKNVYFGEEHLHTRNSFDAFTIGVNQTWDDAYNYAKGEKSSSRPPASA
jgi:hypothetical protein